MRAREWKSHGRGSSRSQTILAFCTLLFALAVPAQASDSIIGWTDSAAALDKARLRDLIDDKLASELQALLTKDLTLEASFSIVISERPYGFFDRERRKILVPLANLYRVYDDLSLKYPEQGDVRQSIFRSTVQFYFLSELIGAIVMDYELPISGWEAERIDALAVILLLQGGEIEQAFLLDAAEEFLLIDRAVGSVQAERFKTEFEADEYRLGQIFCIMESFDTVGFARREWSARECGNQYEAAMLFWSEAMKRLWKEGSRFAHWQATAE